MEAINQLLKNNSAKIILLRQFSKDVAGYHAVSLKNSEKFLIKDAMQWGHYPKCKAGYNKLNSFFEFNVTDIEKIYIFYQYNEYGLIESLKDAGFIKDSSELNIIHLSTFIEKEIEKLEEVGKMYEDFIVNPF